MSAIRHTALLATLLLLSTWPAAAQQASQIDGDSVSAQASDAMDSSAEVVRNGAISAKAGTGPVIADYGPVFDMPATAFRLSTKQIHKVLFDVAGGKRERDTLNRRLETVARFLNMHARNGIAPERLQLAVIMHGGSSFDALSDAAYHQRFGMDNPNTALIGALRNAGVTLYLCGQSAGFNGIAAHELSPQVELALSAMTVTVELDSQGYVVLP